MSATVSASGRRWLAAAAIVLAAVCFVALNVFVGVSLTRARLDLTEEGLYTLSDGTRAVLAAVDEPIRLRFYRSRRLESLRPYLAAHIKRVDELLAQYARLSGGRIQVERYDPAPFSPEEDLAVADGIHSLAVDDAGTLAYFGIAGANSTDDRKVIPFLTPERADFLEYDLTRLISDLSRTEKPVVAVIGSLPFGGGPATGYRPYLAADLMDQAFDRRTISTPVERIDDDVDMVMLLQPTGIDPRTLYAVDQFVQRGGPVLAFLDPLPETMEQGGSGGRGEPLAAVSPLLAAWGVSIGDAVVGDREAAMRVQTLHDGRTVVTDYLPWLELNRANLAADDVVTGDLPLLVMKSAGAIAAAAGGAGTIAPLVQTGPDAAMVPADELRVVPDPVRLLRDFAPGGTPLTLAARVTGPAHTAFPDGPPPEVTDRGVREAHVAAGAAPLNIILVADSDMLADSSWADVGAMLGERVMVPFAANGDFLVNALESLSGGGVLGSLRGRGITERRFEVIDRMTRAAEDRYRATETKLLDEIDALRRGIASAGGGEDGGAILPDAEQQAAVEADRTRLLALRRQLRDVQFALRRDVDALRRRVAWINIWLMPVVVSLIAIGVAVLRRRRAARGRLAARREAVS